MNRNNIEDISNKLSFDLIKSTSEYIFVSYTIIDFVLEETLELEMLETYREELIYELGMEMHLELTQ